jgi:hypothetical protein
MLDLNRAISAMGSPERPPVRISGTRMSSEPTHSEVCHAALRIPLSRLQQKVRAYPSHLRVGKNAGKVSPLWKLEDRAAGRGIRCRDVQKELIRSALI